jgi:hypothetical protein
VEASFSIVIETELSLSLDLPHVLPIAEAKIGVHNVSVTTNPITGRACGAACREDVEKVFPVVKTGADPNHFTVVLPNPVTGEVAEKFNALFQSVP